MFFNLNYYEQILDIYRSRQNYIMNLCILTSYPSIMANS